MAERTIVRLPDHLIRRARRKALAEGRSLTAFIEEGLRRTAISRVSLEDSAALQEMDDFGARPGVLGA